MICARCQRPIELGQLYHQVSRHTDNYQPNPEHWTAGADLHTVVHDYPCPTSVEMVDGRVLINGMDIGPLEQYQP